MSLSFPRVCVCVCDSPAWNQPLLQGALLLENGVRDQDPTLGVLFADTGVYHLFKIQPGKSWCSLPL